jgi:hypothetical protein
MKVVYYYIFCRCGSLCGIFDSHLIGIFIESTYGIDRLFVCFESHEQFFSYLATVIITGDRVANLDLCLALTAFSSEGSFTCHTYCDTGRPLRF